MRRFAIFNCDPGEARTLDPLIKSQLLYQLSYGVKFYWERIGAFLNCDAKVGSIFELSKFLEIFLETFFAKNMGNEAGKIEDGDICLC